MIHKHNDTIDTVLTPQFSEFIINLQELKIHNHMIKVMDFKGNFLSRFYYRRPFHRQ